MPESLSDALYRAGLGGVTCDSCRRRVERRQPRVTLITSWDRRTQHICERCWLGVIEAAAQFLLLLQSELPLN